MLFISTSGYRPPSLISHSPDKRPYLDQSNRVAWHRKHGYNRWNFDVIMCISWDVRYFISTSGSRPPPLIFHITWRRSVLTFDPPCGSMQKICGFRSNSKYIPFAMSGLSVSGFPSAILISGWIRNELCTAAVTSASTKTNAAMLNWLLKLINAFWFNGHQGYHIFTKKQSTPPLLSVT